MTAATSEPNSPITLPVIETAVQEGILTSPNEHLIIAALTLTGPAPAACSATLAALRQIVKHELTGELDPLGPPAAPPGETGEIGFARSQRMGLTITVGFSSSGYSKLGVAAADQPGDLQLIDWAKLGDSPDNADSGDVVVQINADNAFVAEHVLRRIQTQLSSQITLSWVHLGVQRHSSTQPGCPHQRHDDGRAWIGFLDGSSNLNPRTSPADFALTFVNPNDVANYPQPPQQSPATNPYAPSQPLNFPPDLRKPPASEPESTRNGTYLTVRVSETNLKDWDATALTAQEQTIGRTKVRGVALDLHAEDDTAISTPAYAMDQTIVEVAVDAHIRKANPRGPGTDDEQRRIYRRGYPLYEGTGSELIRGLIFVAYGRTISTQFEFITRAWINNPDFPQQGSGVDKLRAFDTHVLAGGYYFVPALADPNAPWSWLVPGEPS